MRLTVIAATGGVGRAVLAQALDAGHHVTAVARDPSRLDRQVRSFAVDLADPVADPLITAVAGADAVLSCLGPRSKAETGIVGPGTARIIAAMQAAGTRRIIAVSGVGLSTVATPNRPKPLRREPGAGPLMNLVTLRIARAVIGTHMRDVAAMEELLAESGLDWTALRPPYLSDGPLTGRYQVAYGTSLPRALRLSRADAAHCMIAAIGDPRASRTNLTAAY
ncbi:NAD(P)-dependent oxidoreductase [Glycomyces harbinensis]|uniref:Putative NADH-flavin reductase n=1 Tax=Glycomyces harbinensis TaxID=58114 RepID=A0A1G6RKB9_9ACTN|nr:NAD(P)H-binding protein [Glycomyces harbinensis]SDD04386.1 Putative NADH-flavin reductase [Glycomyces harbinensis]